MYRNHTIGVVVPAYNEEGFVGDVIESLPDYVDRVYVVDDRSTDGTWDEIRYHAARVNERVTLADGDGQQITANTAMDPMTDRRVVPIRHDENRGVGGAIKTGYQCALEDEIDITAVIAGDGQMDADILPRFLDPIVEGRADYTKGNRLCSGEYRSDMPRFRLFGNAILTFLTRISSGYWEMTDPQNGYTAMSLRALEHIQLDELYEYYGYPNDLLVKLNTSKLRIADVPMAAVYGDEESNITYTSYIPKVSSMLFRNFLWRLQTRYLGRDFHPLALYYVTGLISTALGVLGGLWSAASRCLSGESRIRWVASSAFLLVTGIVLTALGMLMDRQENRTQVVKIDE